MSQPQPPQGLKGGVIFFSLRQRPGHGICRPTLVSCSCSTVRPKAGASLGREGNTGACTHTSLPPLTRPACAMPPVACPAPMSHPVPLRPRTLGLGPPFHVVPLTLPACTCPAKPAAITFGHLCPAKEELGGGGVWKETGTLVTDGMFLT